MSETFLAILISAICHVESGHTDSAINIQDGGSASLGKCQVKYATAKMLGYKGHPTDLWLNSKINEYYAKKYLEKQLKRYNFNVEYAIAAYNTGSVKLNKKGDLVNRKYVEKVLRSIGK